MSNQEIRRVSVIEQCCSGHFTNQEAAKLLGLSKRNVQRLKRKAKTEGSLAVLHGNRERKPHNALSSELISAILLYAEREYKGYNFSHMQEVLELEKQIVVSLSTLRRLLTASGLKSPRKHRPAKAHRVRKRRAAKGELVQMDASRCDWLSDGSCPHLHAAIDDATGEVLAAWFDLQETRVAYVELMLQMNQKYGLPKALYTDGRTVFQYDPKTKKKLSLEQELLGLTESVPQFTRACTALNIPIHITHVPQAKGRIERLWNTLQDRLPKDLRRNGIKTLEEANAFLPTYFAHYNKSFAVKPREDKPAFAAKIFTEELCVLFGHQEYRSLDNGLTFSYKGVIYALPTHKNSKKISLRPRDIVTVSDCHRLGLRVLVDDLCLIPIESQRQTKLTPKKQSQQSLSEICSKIARNNKNKTPWSKWRGPAQQQLPLLQQTETMTDSLNNLTT